MKNRYAHIIMGVCLLLTIIGCTTPKIGIVFGGGGAKGAAEVGVLKVLEEAGIKADYVVGNSMGAVIGGLYAAGYTADEIEEMLLKEEWMWVFDKKKLFTIFSDKRYPTGLVSGPYFREQLDKVLTVKGAHLFHHIKTPFVCVATDLNKHPFEEVDMSEGVVAEAIRISMAFPVPGNAPIKMDGKELADGGIVNNLPVDVARKMGADIVIAIDLEQGSNDFDIGIPTIEAITEWLNTRPDIEKRLKNIDDADIYIHPNLTGFSIKDYDPDSLSKMIEIGMKTAREQFEQLAEIGRNR